MTQFVWRLSRKSENVQFIVVWLHKSNRYELNSLHKCIFLKISASNLFTFQLSHFFTNADITCIIQAVMLKNATIPKSLLPILNFIHPPIYVELKNGAILYRKPSSPS
jgi:hypothetical protein